VKNCHTFRLRYRNNNVYSIVSTPVGPAYGLRLDVWLSSWPDLLKWRSSSVSRNERPRDTHAVLTSQSPSRDFDQVLSGWRKTS
jgi:hypothetical protein